MQGGRIVKVRWAFWKDPSHCDEADEGRRLARGLGVRECLALLGQRMERKFDTEILMMGGNDWAFGGEEGKVPH